MINKSLRSSPKKLICWSLLFTILESDESRLSIQAGRVRSFRTATIGPLFHSSQKRPPPLQVRMNYTYKAAMDLSQNCIATSV